MILLDNDIKSNSIDNIEKTYNVEFIGLNNEEYISSDLKVSTYSIKDKNIQRNSYAVQYNNEEIYNN